MSPPNSLPHSPNSIATYTDALGNSRRVTDPNAIVFSGSYQPFGQDNGTPTGSETYKFTGKPDGMSLHVR